MNDMLICSSDSSREDKPSSSYHHEHTRGLQSTTAGTAMGGSRAMLSHSMLKNRNILEHAEQFLWLALLLPGKFWGLGHTEGLTATEPQNWKGPAHSWCMLDGLTSAAIVLLQSVSPSSNTFFSRVSLAIKATSLLAASHQICFCFRPINNAKKKAAKLHEN